MNKRNPYSKGAGGQGDGGGGVGREKRAHSNDGVHRPERK